MILNNEYNIELECAKAAKSVHGDNIYTNKQ